MSPLCSRNARSQTPLVGRAQWGLIRTILEKTSTSKLGKPIVSCLPAALLGSLFGHPAAATAQMWGRRYERSHSMMPLPASCETRYSVSRAFHSYPLSNQCGILSLPTEGKSVESIIRLSSSIRVRICDYNTRPRILVGSRNQWKECRLVESGNF